MSSNKADKPKLVHSKTAEPRAKPGTPEFNAWLLKRAKETSYVELVLHQLRQSSKTGSYDSIRVNFSHCQEEI